MVAQSKTFAPGASPFRAKGTLWIGIRQFVVERVPGGLEAVDRTLDPETRGFFGQDFLAAGWYDVLPVVDVTNAMAKALRVEVAECQRRSALWHADRDLKGAYAPVLKFATPEAVCRRFTSIYSLLYDFGRAEVVEEQPRKVRACAHGLPECIAAWWMRASECYMDPVLRAAGALNPRLIWEAPQADGERFGVRLVRIPSSTEWD